MSRIAITREARFRLSFEGNKQNDYCQVLTSTSHIPRIQPGRLDTVPRRLTNSGAVATSAPRLRYVINPRRISTKRARHHLRSTSLEFTIVVHGLERDEAEKGYSAFNFSSWDHPCSVWLATACLLQGDPHWKSCRPRSRDKI